MDCMMSCLRQNLPAVLIAALLGALIGLVGGVVIGCAALGGTLVVAATPIGSVGIALTCTGVSLLAFLPVVIAAALAVGTLFAVSTLLFFIGVCAGRCLAEGGVGAAGANAATGALDGVNSSMDCAAANTVISDLEASLADLRAQRDAQQSLVDQREAAVTAARRALTVAAAVLAATSFWNPMAMLAALAALAMTSGLLARATARLVSAQVGLAQIQSQIAALEAALAVALAARDSLCGVADGDADGSDPPGGFRPGDPAVGVAAPG